MTKLQSLPPKGREADFISFFVALLLRSVIAVGLIAIGLVDAL